MTAFNIDSSNPLLNAYKTKVGDTWELNRAVTADVPEDVKATGVFKKVIFSSAPTGENVPIETLRECYENVFVAFDATEEKSIAIPPMSTGAGRVPADISAQVAVGIAANYLINHSEKQVRFVCYGKGVGDPVYTAYESAITHIKKEFEGAKLNIELTNGAIQDDTSDVVVAGIQGHDMVIDYTNSGPTVKRLCEKVAKIQLLQLDAEVKEKERQGHLKVAVKDYFYTKKFFGMGPRAIDPKKIKEIVGETFAKNMNDLAITEDFVKGFIKEKLNISDADTTALQEELDAAASDIIPAIKAEAGKKANIGKGVATHGLEDDDL